MKSTGTRLVLSLGLLVGLAFGCGGGVDQPRSGIGNQTPITMPTGGTASTTAGTGGAPPSTAGATTAGTSPVSMGGVSGSDSGGKPCGTVWMGGAMYTAGAIVSYKGAYYVANFDNPGYDPIVSTYFWAPYNCPTAGAGGSTSAAGTGAGGTEPLGDSNFATLVSESLFNEMFPNRDPFYTYQGLVDATRKYTAFAGTGNADERKREVAAFLANVSRETGELKYVEQIAKDVYCSASDKCPCEAGKLYYGRGPIQISWNYNYCSAGDALGYDLRGQPELVSTNATIAWATGLWFWMTQRGAGTYTPHEAMVSDHGFGETIRSINGDIECTGNGSDGVTARVQYYEHFCQVLGVTPGNNESC